MADRSHPRHPDGLSRIGTTVFPQVARIGYGAMQLGDVPSAEDAAAVLRRAVELGVNHIDTASFYARGEVNHHIRQALAPYPDDLVIVSKVGAAPATGPIPLTAAQQPAQLRAAVEDDLRQLGLECIPVVNLRRLDLGPGLSAEGDQIVDLDDQLAEMIALRNEGKIGAIGVSNVPLDLLRRALPAGIVCVQNAYSLLDRSHEGMLDFCTAEGIAWVPFFPLGSAFTGFPNVADNTVVRDIADELGVTAAQVGLAWLLTHAPNTLLIPGTRSITHLEENIASADIALSPAAIARLDAVTTLEESPQHRHGAAPFRKAPTPGGP